MNLPEVVASIAVTAIFNAGIFYAVVKQLRKDVNGIGMKLRIIEHVAGEDRVANALTVMLLAKDPEERYRLATLMMTRKK